MAARETFSFQGANVPLFALNSTVEQIGFSLQQIALRYLEMKGFTAGGGKFLRLWCLK